ncbi:MAG: endonuclease/exonuclease/phosphatase family protein [Pirellulales bacterium]|nr:endonuclease/exonuclease/phosphatase family protein [Pirellulales bacterium]
MKTTESANRKTRRRDVPAAQPIGAIPWARLRTRGVWIPAAVALLLLSSVVWSGSQRTPLGPAEGLELSPPAATNTETATAPSSGSGLLVTSYNIHGGKGTDRVRDLSRIADNLRGAQLIGLNELHRLNPFSSSNQAEQLGAMLDMPWLFAPTEQKWWYHDFGNGLLTSLSVDYWQRIPLSRNYGKSFRNVVLTAVQYRGRTIQVLVTHLDRSDDRERRAQVRAVGDLFASLDEPAILMGDLNSDATEPQIQRLMAKPGVESPLHVAQGEQAPRTIDWIFTRGLVTLDAGLEQSVASDHPRVWARLELPERSASVRYSRH